MQQCYSSIKKKLPFIIQTSGIGYLHFGNYHKCVQNSQMNYNFLSFKLDNPYSVGSPYTALCLPQVCSKQIINDTLSLILPQFNLTLISIQNNIDIQSYQYPYDYKFYITLAVLMTILVLALVGTFFSKILKLQKNNHLLINAFNIKNSLQIFKHNKSNLNVINGVKSIAMIWVIIGHQYIFKLSYAVNSATLEYQIKTNFFCFLIAGLMAVDIFFFIGGFLVAFSFLKQKSKDKSKFLFAILHRILRFWPCYIIAILIYYTIYMHLGWGPVWSQNQPSVEFCDHWWRPLLFIDNLLGDGRDMCLSWGWYMQNDMQLFIYSMLILLAVNFNKKVGNIILWLSIFLSVLYTFYECQVNQYKTLANLEDFASWSTYFGLVYIKPWSRGPPYLIGLALGINYFDHLQYKKKQKHRENQNYSFEQNLKNEEIKKPFLSVLENKFKLNKVIRIATQLCGIFVMIFIILIIRPLQQDWQWPQWVHSFYMAFSKVFYVIALGMILAPSLLGIKSWISSLLDTFFFNFLGKISFCVYLLHLNVIFRWVYMAINDFYFTSETVFPLFVSHLIQSLFFGFIMTILIQIPFGKITKAGLMKLKILLSKKNGQNKNDQSFSSQAQKKLISPQK